MATERRNPLPAGRYWLDVANAKAPIFDGWLEAFKASARVENTEASPETQFYIFSTTAPLVWLGPVLGFPTIAPASIRSKADTVQRPDAPDPFAGFSFDGFGSTALLLIGAYFVFGGGSKR